MMKTKSAYRLCKNLDLNVRNSQLSIGTAFPTRSPGKNFFRFKCTCITDFSKCFLNPLYNDDMKLLNREFKI